MGLVKFRVENGLKHLMQDEEFKRRMIRAFEVQIEQNHGWGFTVKYEGYRIRFDIDDKESNKWLIVYKGYAEEEPKSVQKSLLEVC